MPSQLFHIQKSNGDRAPQFTIAESAESARKMLQGLSLAENLAENVASPPDDEPVCVDADLAEFHRYLRATLVRRAEPRVTMDVVVNRTQPETPTQRAERLVDALADAQVLSVSGNKVQFKYQGVPTGVDVTTKIMQAIASETIGIEVDDEVADLALALAVVRAAAATAAQRRTWSESQQEGAR